MVKEWKEFDCGEDCPRCGSSVEVYNELEEGFCYDGDTLRCVNCGEEGSTSVDEDGFHGCYWPYRDLPLREYERQEAGCLFKRTGPGSLLWDGFMKETTKSKDCWNWLFELFTME